MDRRRFFRLLSSGVTGIALQEAIPLNRVWSFPSKIVIPPMGGVPLPLEKDPLHYAFLVGNDRAVRVPARYVFQLADAYRKGILGPCVGFDYADEQKS